MKKLTLTLVLFAVLQAEWSVGQELAVTRPGFSLVPQTVDAPAADIPTVPLTRSASTGSMNGTRPAGSMSAATGSMPMMTAAKASMAGMSSMNGAKMTMGERPSAAVPVYQTYMLPPSPTSPPPSAYVPEGMRFPARRVPLGW
jgi:hypothetical protein